MIAGGYKYEHAPERVVRGNAVRQLQERPEPGQLTAAYSAMSHQLSAQATTAHTAITRISSKRCPTLPGQRGSSIAPKYCARFSTDMPRSSVVARTRHHASAPGGREKSH